jgi:hypothetical protein
MSRWLMSILTIAVLGACCSNSHKSDGKKRLLQHNMVRMLKIRESYYKESVFSALNERKLLSKLYDSNKFVDSSGEVLWRPNFHERLQLLVSDDGFCHTQVDTILYFRNHDQENCAVVIFANYHYFLDDFDHEVLKRGGSHFEGVRLGIALFAETEEKEWCLIDFKKYFTNLGYFGELHSGREDTAEFSLKKLRKDWMCLSLKQGIGGNTGVFWGYETFFSLDYYPICKMCEGIEEYPWMTSSCFQEVFSYNYYFSYENTFGNSSRFLISRKLNCLMDNNSDADFQLVVNENGKKRIEYYRYDEFIQKYTKVQQK